LRDERTDLAVVIDDQDMRGAFHGSGP